METLPNHPLLEVTAEDIKYTREFYNINDIKKINDSLDAVEEWMKKQDHLVEAQKYMSREYLERVFFLARGSVEGAKQKIDKLFSARTLMPELCMNKTLDEFTKTFNCVRVVPLPKLCPLDKSRAILLQYTTDKLDDFSMLSYLRYVTLIGDYRLHYDYSLGDRFILDFNNVNHISFIGKINPMVIKKCEVLCTEGYGTKIKGLHLLNAPSFIDKVVKIFKSVFKEKVASRIYVHSTYDDLYKHIPKEILPKDYGGDEPSCENLFEKWQDLLKTKTATKLIEEFDKLVSDESKRTSSTFNKELLGLQGSFRSLDVD